MQQPKWIIYVLKDPRTEHVRYVGWTTKTTKRRLTCHLSDARQAQRTHRTKWIHSLLTIGLLPLIEVIQEGLGPGATEAEMQWIARYRSEGANLTNATDGKEGLLGNIPSSETRKKISIANKGRKQSPEFCIALGIRAKAHNTGRVRTAEQRVKITAALRLRKRSPESMEKFWAATRGKPRSEEHCRKISLAAKGRKVSLETRAKMSASRTPEQWAAAAAHARSGSTEESHKKKAAAHTPEEWAKLTAYARSFRKPKRIAELEGRSSGARRWKQ